MQLLDCGDPKVTLDTKYVYLVYFFAKIKLKILNKLVEMIKSDSVVYCKMI